MGTIDITLVGAGAQAIEAGEWVDRYRIPIYRVALRMLGDRHEAEDVAQEVLLRLWDTRAGLKPGSDPGAWAYALTLNHCRDLLRSHRHRLLTLTPDADLEQEDLRPTADVALDQARRERKVLAALQQLPPSYREVLVLRDMEGQPYRQICQILEANETTLKARVIRARRALARALATMSLEQP